MLAPGNWPFGGHDPNEAPFPDKCIDLIIVCERRDPLIALIVLIHSAHAPKPRKVKHNKWNGNDRYSICYSMPSSTLSYSRSSKLNRDHFHSIYNVSPSSV